LSCEAETCRARRRLVGDAAVWPRTGRLASEGLDEDLHAFNETQRQVESALLLDVIISKGTPSSSCSPADRSVHLVDDGFIVLKLDNLAVDGVCWYN
jgi:hypothetical protein